MERKTEYSIFLHIIEGIGFNEKNDQISLHATLNGVKLEVDGHNTENLTIFNSNCIWECMYDDLKKMKTDNRPIKIECFHKVQKNNKEIIKSIGFVLLPIRGLQIIKSLRQLQIKLHWHKLCGLAAEWRQAKPEIYLAALITTKQIMESGSLEEFLEPKAVDINDSIYIQSSETSLMLKSQLGIYVNLLEDECLLQVGNGPNDCDTFIITLLLKEANNLDQLLAPGDCENSVFRFHYDFLGNASDVTLVPNNHGAYKINEKISVNYKSSLESLMDYFKRVFYIPIDIYYNDTIKGSHKFSFVDLLPPSLEVFNHNEVWEVKSSFQLPTLFAIFDSTVRPTVEYVFTLSYILNLSSRISPATEGSRGYFDEGARGDMGQGNHIFELPPTAKTDYQSAKNDEASVRSARHIVDEDDDIVTTKLCRSEPLVSYRKQKPEKPEEPEELEESEEPMEPNEPKPMVDDIAYEIIAELEDWKCKQIDDFLNELEQKEVDHLSKLSAEWDRQKKEIMQKMQDKLDECARLTEKLEAAQIEVRAKSQKQYDEERAFEHTKHELDKRYTVRFMEIEEKARRIKDQMDYELKVQELRFKELQMEKDHEAEENIKLRTRITELTEQLEEMRKNTMPKQQLAGLFEDLRQQSKRYEELEKSKRFYKEQWAKSAREVHRLKLYALKAEEEKLKSTNCLGLDNIMDLKSVIFQERAALHTERSELRTIRDALNSDSEMSSTSNIES